MGGALLEQRKVMLKILQARLQQYVNRELPDVQAGFRKGIGTRDRFANIRWIISAPNWASLIAQLVKTLPAIQETSVRFLGLEDPLEKG